MRIDFVLLALCIAAAALWMEHREQVDIEGPAPVLSVAPGAACAASDAVPYSASCLTFLGADHAPIPRQRVASSALMRKSTDIQWGPQCPDNDNVPYTPDCIRFMSGWFWRAN